ncbi:hypothetical protein [Phosphitispora fastidiosa]|uniref:hypothetical protein n=1 Tax=Phosphitispora fastidiosa TaxID=2837202 RepID=UPI001E3023CC|nr:hypothetical protein [Phosphitispora fastidiosa]MBU7008645.1 hypothetical protein [Phosphitispora fastidiosa]
MCRFLLFLLVSTLFVNGCNDGSGIIFEGESSHWTASYVEKIHETGIKSLSGKFSYSNTVSWNLSLKYKGPNLSNVGPVKYSYNTEHGGGEGETSLDRNGYLNITGRISGEDAAMTSCIDTIAVILEWHGMSEPLELTAR